MVRSVASGVLGPHLVVKHFKASGVRFAVKQGTIGARCPYLRADRFQTETESYVINFQDSEMTANVGFKAKTMHTSDVLP